MLNVRTVILSVVVLVVLMLTAQLATAGTEVVSDPPSDSVIALEHQDRYDKMNEAPIPSYLSPLDVCYDVPLREAASCRNTSQAPIPSYRSPLDVCYDVPLREVASCRNASQAPAPSLERSRAAEDQLYIIDSATRSYIAWGEALEAAGKLGNSAACSNTTQENLFAGIDSNLDSATRSYIAWGLALQAKDDIRALCR